ncbi:MAG: ARMT1-like domain-containing protein [Bacteroidota bacterium]|nr:ARMT1-like domain-containing protein [Bacteroidota bacterium]
MSFYFSLFSNANNLLSPEISKELHSKLKSLNGTLDPYLEEKRKSNDLALELYDHWKDKLKRSDDPFNLSLRLAIAGNIMDYASGEEFDVEQTIKYVLQKEFAINCADLLKTEIEKAKNVLYLGDNAGEIVFDKLFIETLNHPNLTYVVRGAPVINDVTIEDAIYTGVTEITNVISNGYDAPSTILNKCSNEFLDYYNNADVIISKGQGNFEGLIDNNMNKKVFFLLMVKCEVIAEMLGVYKGDFVVCKN